MLAFVAATGELVLPGPESLLRHLYAVPVVGAGVRFGPAGGALAAGAVTLLAAPGLLARLERDGLSTAIVEELVSFLTLLVLGPLIGALARAARHQRARYQLLLATQRALAAEESLEPALESLRACLSEGLGDVEVGLVVRDGDRLVVTGGAAVAPGSAAARVLSTGTPMFVADAGGAPRPRRVFVAPLLARGDVVGVLAVERLGELGRRARRLITSLGLHLGLALENMRLRGRQRRFTEELAEQVAVATRRLEEMDRAKSAFVAIASHELRTPLTAMLGFSELLATRRWPADEVRRLAAIAQRETERLARIVDDLLDLSRVERGLAPRLSLDAVAVERALDEALAVFRRPEASHRVQLDCAAALPPVRADADALHRIVTNLVSNAIKYAPVGSAVAVRARLAAARGRVEISVEDAGPGIPAEALPRLFEPYYRAPDAWGRARGTGLGLAVVKALVDAHDGSIRIESTPGVGTRVIVELPSVS